MVTRIQSVLKVRTGQDWKVIAKQDTPTYFDIALRVPVGFSFLDVEKQIDALSANVGSLVEIVNRGGAVVVRIPKKDFPDMIPFHENMFHVEQKILLGYDREGSPVWSNDINPHLLLAGASGYGKTDTLRFYIAQVLHRDPAALIYIVDMKGCSFLPFEQTNTVKVVDDLEGAAAVLRMVDKERKKRSKLIRSTGSRDALHPLPWLYVIIDEFGELPPNPAMSKEEKKQANQCRQAVSSIIRVGRELKTACWICTQYPTTEILHNQVKSNLINVISLKLEQPIQSQTVLDTDAAYLLPSDKMGRAIVKGRGMIQVPYVGKDNQWLVLLQLYKKECFPHEERTEESDITDLVDGEDWDDETDF